MTEIVTNVSKEQWSAFLYRCSSATIYHTPEWKDILQNSFNYKPFHLFAKNDDGDLCGILPLFQIDSRLTGNRLTSLPYSYICGAIGDSEYVIRLLINESIKLYDKLNCDYIDLRYAESSIALSEFYEDTHYSTYILELSSNIDEVWKKLDKSSVRWAINKAKKDGVQIRKGRTLHDFELFNNLNQKSKRNHGVPAHPLNFLKNIHTNMDNGFVSLYLAEFDDKAIAGIVTLNFKDAIIYAYGASDDDYLKYRPNNLLVWKAIEDCCENGFKSFDFGRTSPDNTGLIQFKRRWGTTEKKVFYYYYPETPNLSSNDRVSTKYRLMTGLWKRLPLSLSQPIGNIVFKHFG